MSRDATASAPGSRAGEVNDLGRLLSDVQTLGVRIAGPVERRLGGAGPSDAGMVRIAGRPVTVPVSADFVERSPFELRRDDGGWGLYREGRRIADAFVPGRPRCYDLTTGDGIPYWKVALLHLDSLASTVVQRCVWWGTEDQCGFCGIELTLHAGGTIAVKRPHHLAEVAAAAKALDGAVDVTLTTGTTPGPDKGARYLGRCARAIKESSGLPVQAQFEPPDDPAVFAEIREMGVDAVGMHVESFDPVVLARVAGAKARTGIEGYVRAWRQAVDVFGRGQVSTYVILGMGEDRRVTLDGIKRAADIGVYPFVVPLRPVPGSLMHDVEPPTAEEVAEVFREVASYLDAVGLHSAEVKAGCARCQACSAMAAFERVRGHRRALPVVGVP